MSMLPFDDAHNIIVVDNVKMGGLADGTEVVVEPSHHPGVPVADEERDPHGEDTEYNKEDEFPFNEFEAANLFKDALPLDLVWFVRDFLQSGRQSYMGTCCLHNNSIFAECETL